MADEDSKEKPEKPEKPEKQDEKQGKQEETKAEAGDKKSLVGRLLPGLIIGGVIIIFAGAGFTLGRLFAGPSAPEASEQTQSAQTEDMEVEDSTDGQKGWYYNLEPVIANLDVPDVTRYVRASLTLELSPSLDEKEGRVLLDEKKPVLTNWLTVYLASLSIDDIRGERNLKRIQSQVLDAFNEKLFPDSKPKIKRVLFKEFAVQ